MTAARVQDEVHVVREVLEGALPPQVATALMFTALRSLPSVPESRDAVLRMCRGPLSEALDKRVGDAARQVVVQRIEQVLSTGSRQGTEVPLEFDEDGMLQLDVEVDLDVELDGLIGVDIDTDTDASRRNRDSDDGAATLAVPVTFRVPVPVLVVSKTFRFAEQLVASLGDERVYVTAAMSEKELRKSAFTAQPILVVVDGAGKPTMEDDALALALRDLPDSALAVLWGSDTEYGARLSTTIKASGAKSVLLRTEDGLGPLLDLVLSRYDAGD